MKNINIFSVIQLFVTNKSEFKFDIKKKFFF